MLTDDEFYSLPIAIAGRRLDRAFDRISRYCGLAWSGGPPETWAFRYYDTIVTDPNTIVPVDVVCTSALHPGISRADLAWFQDNMTMLDEWLARVPNDDIGLSTADDDLLDHLAALATFDGAPSIALLSKVLHRKRPRLIPLIDRHIIDRYRPITGQRTPASAWQPLLDALRADLTLDNIIFLNTMALAIEEEAAIRLSYLRLIDIAVWMDGNEDR